MNFIKKSLLLMALYLMIAQILFFNMQPKAIQPNEYFRVCVLENGVPDTFIIKDIKPNQTVCTQELDHNFPSYGSMHLRQLPNQVWELETWGDSMGDPFIYRYHIDNQGKIMPLNWAYGGMMSRIIAYVWAVGITAILWKLGKFLINKIHKKSVQAA